MAWPNGTRLKTFANGGSFFPADANNIEERMLQIAGYRGQSIITTEEARTNTSYGTLTTPDEVTGIVVPTDGILCIHYAALWKNSVTGAGGAAIFIGGNQLRKGIGGGITEVDATTGPPSGTLYTRLMTSSMDSGIRGDNGGSVADATLLTTGLSGSMAASGTRVGGHIMVHELAAGTYTVNVQFKATSGTVTAKERRLRVWTMVFT
jgi:hypothetical protein